MRISVHCTTQGVQQLHLKYFPYTFTLLPELDEECLRGTIAAFNITTRQGSDASEQFGTTVRCRRSNKT